jgi:CrcB protein
MKAWLAVALGGALGSVGRYWLVGQTQAWWAAGFPVGTLAVNVVGSSLMGFLYFWMAGRGFLSGWWPQLLLVGLLGGFTTFSAFSLDALALVSEGLVGRALVYVGASLLLCLGGVWLGMISARAFTG